MEYLYAKVLRIRFPSMSNDIVTGSESNNTTGELRLSHAIDAYPLDSFENRLFCAESETTNVTISMRKDSHRHFPACQLKLLFGSQTWKFPDIIEIIKSDFICRTRSFCVRIPHTTSGLPSHPAFMRCLYIGNCITPP